MQKKIEVLDKGFVELVDVMGTDLTPVNAARVSFGKSKDAFEESDRKLIRYLLKNEHTSPLRHCQLQFRVKAPIFVFRQWMKHRIGSEFNEISSRYVELGSAEFYEPETFRTQSASNKQGSGEDLVPDTNGMAVRYQHRHNILSQATYDSLRDLGVAKEQARMVMPVSQYSEVFWTVSLQAVLHFISLRMDGHAQKEIQDYARAVLELTKECFPMVVSEYEAIQDKKRADKAISLAAVELALVDATYELNPSTQVVEHLNAMREKLRGMVLENLEHYADEL